MAVNKVIYDGETLIDLTSDTVEPGTLAKGTTAHDKSGKQIAGTMDIGGILDVDKFPTTNIQDEMVYRGKTAGYDVYAVMDGSVESLLDNAATEGFVIEIREAYRISDVTTPVGTDIESNIWNIYIETAKGLVYLYVTNLNAGWMTFGALMGDPSFDKGYTYNPYGEIVDGIYVQKRNVVAVGVPNENSDKKILTWDGEKWEELPTLGAYTSMVEQLDEQKKEIRSLNFTISSQEDTISSLESEVVDRGSRISQLESALSEYEAGYNFTKYGVIASSGDGAIALVDLDTASSVYSLTIPSFITEIGPEALAHSNIYTIKLHSSITKIGDGAFAYCDNLHAISVDDNNSVYKSVNGHLYTKDGTTLIRVAGNNYDLSSDTIFSNNVTVIGVSAFAGITKYNPDITIPDGVTTICNDAFVGSDFASISIPNTVTSFGDYAFYGCRHLGNIVYRGTRAQWDAITKGTNWRGGFSLHEKLIVTCTDGTYSY